MRLSLSTAFSVLLWLSASAQHDVDSLERLLRQKQTDSARLQILNSLSVLYYDGNPDRLTLLSREALHLANKSDRKELVVAAYLNWASAEEWNGNYDSSIFYNLKALTLYEEMNDSLGMSAALNNAGITYMQTGDYSSCVYSLQRALAIDEARHDTVNLSIDFINLADVYLRARYFDDSKHWARLGLQYAVAGSPANRPYAAEILGTILLEENHIDSAFYYFEYARRLGVELGHEYIVNRSYLHFGKAFARQHVYDSAMYYLNEGINMSKSKSPSDVLIPSLITLSHCYKETGKSRLAIKTATDALLLSHKIKNYHLAKESSLSLAEYYAALNKNDSSVIYFRKAASYMQSILDKSIKGSIEAKTFDLRLQQEKAQKNEAISDLEHQRKVYNQQRLILGGAIVVVISLAAIMFLIFRSNKMRTIANAQLLLKNVELNRLNTEISGLINTIVHDLKSPLNTLHGIFKLMEPDLKQDKKFSEFIDYGNQVIQNAHTIVTELLELREMEENPTALLPSSFYLKDLEKDLIPRFMPMAAEKNLSLTLDTDNSIVYTDRALLSRILDNLISNAIKFSPPGKQVLVEGRVVEGQALFRIKDEGPGFHEKDLEKVYGKFQKLSARPTGGESSNGLGLAIVRLLVNRLKGTIRLESKWGEGACFIVSVPALPK